MDEPQQQPQPVPEHTPTPDPMPATVPQAEPPPVPQTPATQPATHQPTPMSAEIDLSGNKGMAILAYLGILIIVPFLTGAKNDPFVKFHLKQGLVLIIVWIAAGIISSMLSFVFYASGLFILSFIFPLIYLGLAILDIIGIVNAASGKINPLPVIGSIGNKFNF